MRNFKRPLCHILTAACLGIMLSASYSQADPALPQHTEDMWQDLASVKWSVDNGTTWGNDELTVGQTVVFQFVMHKDYKGTHYADLLKAWIDWDDDGFEASESIIFDKHEVWATPHVNQYPGDNVEESYTFISSGITLTNALLGDHWLLARVTCSESLLAGSGKPWSYQWDELAKQQYDNLFTSDRALYQGEAELWKITVNPIPEPGTMLLFGTGFIGLAGLARRKQD